MPTQIDEDAGRILSLLADAPRNEYVEAAEIARRLDLSADRVNDATAFLVEAGFAEWLQVMGTDPFDFGDAMITPRGRRRRQQSVEVLPPGVERSMNQKLLLFVSHATEDVDLARGVVDLITKALNLPAAAVRCTSVDGYRLPAGVNTDEQLRREVHDAVAFIGIVSYRSLRSMYVLFELGARWGAGKNLVPLIAHGVPASVMSGPLAGLNALRTDNSSQLQQLVQDLGYQLSIAPQNPAVFDRALQDLLRIQAAEPPSEGILSLADDLPTEADAILVALTTEDGQTPEELAEALGLSLTKAEYILDLLKDRELVGSRNYIARPSEYFLKKDGRRRLIENGLVS